MAVRAFCSDSDSTLARSSRITKRWATFAMPRIKAESTVVIMGEGGSMESLFTCRTSLTPSTTMPTVRLFTLAPDEGFEIKLVMEKDAKATFEWFTDGPGVNYDNHADGEGINYHGYGKGTNTPRQFGELVAAFKGQHGWFWRNRTEDDVTITWRTSGEYTYLKQYP